jgi:hypothetical protein
MNSNWMKTMLAAQLMAIASMSYSQEKSDHDLVKGGEPVPGMSAQQVTRPATSPGRSDEKVKETTQVPLINDNTLNDEEFDRWRVGETFLGPESEREKPADSIKIIERPRRTEKQRP